MPHRHHPRSPLEVEVLQFQDLQTLSGVTLPSSVEQWARSQGIHYGRDAKGGIWTTVTALNLALGIGSTHEGPKLEVDMVF